MGVIEQLNLPKASLNIEQTDDGKLFVWCIIRRKKLILTPEEWVRQHLIHYLIFTVGIPKERIVSEYYITINGLNRRCDLVVVDRFGRAKLIVECKATHITINEKALFQIAHYNRELQVDYLMLSNGIVHQIINIDRSTDSFTVLQELRAEWFI